MGFGDEFLPILQQPGKLAVAGVSEAMHHSMHCEVHADFDGLMGKAVRGGLGGIVGNSFRGMKLEEVIGEDGTLERMAPRRRYSLHPAANQEPRKKAGLRRMKLPLSDISSFRVAAEMGRP